METTTPARSAAIVGEMPVLAEAENEDDDEGAPAPPPPPPPPTAAAAAGLALPFKPRSRFDRSRIYRVSGRSAKGEVDIMIIFVS